MSSPSIASTSASGSRRATTGEPLKLPTTRQLVAILERRLTGRERFPDHCRVWFFTSETSRSGRIVTLQQLNARTGEAAVRSFGSACCATASSPWRPGADAADEADETAG